MKRYGLAFLVLCAVTVAVAWYWAGVTTRDTREAYWRGYNDCARNVPVPSNTEMEYEERNGLSAREYHDSNDGNGE